MPYSDYESLILSYFNKCRFDIDFPYPKLKIEEIKKHYNNLKKRKFNLDNFNTNARLCLDVVKTYHPSIFKGNKKGSPSPYEAWHNDDLLWKCIENRVKYIGINLSYQNILTGFNVNKLGPTISLFNPLLAKYLIKKYLNEYNEVFDPCSGYSGRMLGCCSLSKYYIGQDINPITIGESIKLKDDLLLNASLSVKDSLNSTGEYECLFTCPPYGDKENWGQNIDILSCDEWIYRCLNNYKCKRYLFVVDTTMKYKNYIVEELINKSHLGESKEYIILIEG